MSKRPMAVAFGVTALIVAVAAAALLALGWERPQKLFGDKIGLVELRGVISDPQPVLKALDQFRRDASVKAIVLRVDSPGGGVAASQEIYRQLEVVKKTKPVVCSMGGVAASGGLYVAVNCSKIVASPGTITGSIGVISTIPDLQELLAKLGIKVETIRTGKLKAAGQPTRPLSPEERAMIQGLSAELYEQFLTAVATARGIPIEELRPVADGRVFTGQKAQELGLVDELGNLPDAINLAAKLGGITTEPEVVRPDDKRDHWMWKLMRDEASSLIKSAISAAAPSGPQYLYRPLGQ